MVDWKKKLNAKPVSSFWKKIEEQLDVPLADLRAGIPKDPQWDVKKNSEGEKFFWYGYKDKMIS